MIDNGHIYKPANGSLSIEEVAEFFGVQKRSDNRYHLSDICRAAGIKVWSKIKPVRFNTAGNITTAQRDSVNNGVDCSDTSTGCFSSNLTSLLDRAIETSAQWTYLRPRGVVNGSYSEWFRLLDFDGYNNNAGAPFSQNADIVGNATSYQAQYIPVNIAPVIQNANLQVKELVEALTRNGNAISEYRYGVLYRDVNSSGTPSLSECGSQYTLTNLVLNTAFDVHFNPPASYTQSVVYDCVIIAFVRNNGNYWATFLPNTYFQAKIALFSVGVEGQTLSFEKEGGSRFFDISGYCWKAEWATAGINMQMIPSSATGTVVPYVDSVELRVSRAPSNPDGHITKRVVISVSPRVDDTTVAGGDYTKEFTVYQECDVSNFIRAVDSQGNPTNGITFVSLEPEAVTSVRIQANVTWEVTSILWDDDNTTDNPNTDTNRISVSPNRRVTPGSGTLVNTLVDVWATNGIAPGRRYKIRFVNTDPNRQAEDFVLIMISQNE